jgi:hypothetical protein
VPEAERRREVYREWLRRHGGQKDPTNEVVDRFVALMHWKFAFGAVVLVLLVVFLAYVWTR